MGKSSGQVTGYKYLANFLLFIGNPIEKLLNINFDKRGWIANERISYGSNGEMIYIEKPNLYGENEGGVAGTMRVKHGTNKQTASTQYKKYMASLALPTSAYPYQSYIIFGGGGFSQGSWDLTEEELEDVGDDLDASNKYLESGFYLGNSGYMKEMLLWPKRIHVRNDGREQWYDGKAEIKYTDENGTSGLQLKKNKDLVLAEASKRLQNPWYGTKKIDGAFHEIETTSSSPGLLGTNGVWHFDAGTEGKIGDVGTIKTSFNTGVLVAIELLLLCDDGLQDFSWSGSKWYIKEEWGETGWVTCKKLVLITNEDGTGSLRASIVNGFPSGSDSQHRVDASCALMDPSEFTQTIESLDINPIHKIREILTDDTAINKPESDVNNTNFMKAADRIFDEGLGISWAITEKSCLDAINELCGHIEAGVRVNRQTGLYEMVLFRDDWFEENEIHALAVNKIKSMSLDVSNADEAINQLNVSYYNREAIKDSSFSVAENASIRNLNGRVNAEDADFPYFMNQRNAAVVAQWKLKQMSSPVWSGSFTTAAYEARRWNRYDLLKLAWPRKWQGTITVRIMKINLGKDADVSIDFVEVVPYSSELSSNIVIDTPIDVAPLPPQPCQYEPFELPYYLAVMALGQRKTDDELAYENNYGLVGVVAEKPQNNSLYAVMMTHDGTEWLRAATIDYEATADLDQSISKTSTSFTVKNSSALANIAAGTLVKCGSEWIVFQGVDLETGVVNVKRGALDFGPQSWQSGTKLYFCGNDVAYDQTEYVSGEEVLVAALTATPSGLQELDGSIAIEMNARAFRPYPPANVKINGEHWPEDIETDLVLTWVDRNRIQQTGGELLGWFDAGVTLESGVTYQLTLTELDENQIELRTQNLSLGTLNTYTFQTSAMNANTRTIEITLKTLRDGYECLNPFFHTVELSQFFSAPYDLTVEFKND